MVETLNVIGKAVAGLSGTALAYAGALAIAGTLAMAILQVIKELTPLRRAYQRGWLEDWFQARAARLVRDLPGPDRPLLSVQLAPDRFSPEKAEMLMVELATGGERNAFYDLSTEQLVAQMNAAAQVALEYPAQHFALLAIVSQGADAKDLEALLEREGRASDSPAGGRSLEGRNRVGGRIQRNLDGIQIALGSRWRLWMQSASILLTVAFVEWAIIANVQGPGFDHVLAGVVLGVVGGYLAPVTRDIVAALQGLRKA